MAGVSISTVSRVINNTSYVSDEVRKRVEKVLEETGYQPNSLARELQTNRTNTVGVILPRIDLSYFAAIYDGLSEILRENGINTLLANTRDLFDEEIRSLKIMHEKRVDGIFYFATAITEEHKKLISKLRMPVMIIGQTGDFLKRPAIYLDSFGGAKAMVSYLISLGHRRIACIAVSDHDKNMGTMRRLGYLAALEEHNIKYDPNLMFQGDFEYKSGARAVDAILAMQEEKPTAIFCVTDRLAIATVGALGQNGIQIPKDISVACLDDPVLMKHISPSITTMSYDYILMGKIAGEKLIEYIKNKNTSFEQIVMPYTLEERASTGLIAADGGGNA